MTEYIKREAVIEANEGCFFNRGRYTLFVGIDTIQKIPAANVVEVVHAKWKPYTASNQFTHTCTNCHVDVNEKTPYCPYCGAIMSSWGED